MLARLLCLLTAFSLAATAATQKRFEIKDHQFMLNGRPFKILSGEMHYPRIPEPYWRQRLKMVKAMGLNAVDVYCFWNYHETEKGRFNFKGNADVAKFVREAKEEGLYVILRPGPYVCAEWDFGGFPYWLLTEPGCVVRSDNGPFLHYASRYLKKLGGQLAPLQISHGGNILMVQVENEYGSYGHDKTYIGKIRDAIVAAGFDVPLFSADGDSQMPSAEIPGVLPGLNGGVGPEVFKAIDRFAPGGPYFAPEVYPGWLCHWGEQFPRSGPKNSVNDYNWFFHNNASFSFYMIHGGTNFGFWNGANFGGNYQPHITSYDYDAPISENGAATPKYTALRESAIAVEGKLADVPPAIPVISFPRTELHEMAGVLDNLPAPIHSSNVVPMEKLGQGYGFIDYRTHVSLQGPAKLVLKDLRDYAVVMVDGFAMGTLDRRRKQQSMELNAGKKSFTLDILVENCGRINYGSLIPDNLKGITQSVTLDGVELKGWDIYKLPMNSLKGIKYLADTPVRQPQFVRGMFQVDSVGDTWIDMRGWNKGVVWVNGHNLGRFNWVGPQQALYCPGCWLKNGKNEIVVFELVWGGKFSVEGLNHAVLDERRDEPPLQPARPKSPVALSDLRVISVGDLPAGNTAHDVAVTPVTARYLALEGVTAFGTDSFCSMSELFLFNGKLSLGRNGWKVVECDSEETEAEDGKAENLFDADPTTIWHTVWSVNHKPLPHHVIIDLGKPETFDRVRLMPRSASNSGLMKGYRLLAGG